MKRWFHKPLIYIIACYGLEILPCSAQTQEAQELAPVKVEGRPYGEEIIGPYNQPRWSAWGRFSADTDVYVLPPYAFYLDLDYHGTFPRVGKSDHLFTQELELGLLYRFQLASAQGPSLLRRDRTAGVYLDDDPSLAISSKNMALQKCSS